MFRLFSISIFLFISTWTIACGYWPMTESYRFGLFFPHNQYHKQFFGLSFTSEYYHDRSNQFGIISDRNKNIQEWVQLTQSKEEDILELLYHTDASAIDRNGNFHTKHQDNSFYKWLMKPENKEYLDYFYYAKNCETNYLLYQDPWEEDKLDDRLLETDPNEMEGKIKNTENPFLKKRYAFQYIKFSFYTGDPELIIALWENHFSKESRTSIIDYWAMYYAGVSYLRMHQNEKATLLLSECFLNSDDKRIAALEKVNTEVLTTTLAKTIKEDQKFALRSMIAAKQPYLCNDLLGKIAEYDTRHPVTEFLFSREISKYEDFLLTEKISGYKSFSMEIRSGINFWDKNPNLKEEIEGVEKEFNQFLRLLKRINGNIKASFWKLALTHAEVMAGSEKMYYSEWELENGIGENHPLFLQSKITSWFAHSIDKDKSSGELLSELLSIYNYLQANKEIGNSEFTCDRLLAWMFHYYDQRNKTAEATLILEKICSYDLYFPLSEWTPAWGNYPKHYLFQKGTSKTARELQAMFNIQNPDEQVHFLIDKLTRDPLRKTEYLDWCGTLLMNENQYEEALSAWKDIPKPYWKNETYRYYLNDDPFMVHPGDMHKSTVKKRKRYTKPAMVRELIRIDKEIAGSNPEKAENARIRKAAFLYNSTYYGNSWLLVKPSWSAYEEMKWGQRDKDYYGCKSAANAFEAIYRTSPRKEIRAFALMMLARCNKNETFRQQFSAGNTDDFSYDISSNTWVKIITDQTENTEYVLSLYQSCGGREAYWSQFSNFIP